VAKKDSQIGQTGIKRHTSLCDEPGANDIDSINSNNSEAMMDHKTDRANVRNTWSFAMHFSRDRPTVEKRGN